MSRLQRTGLALAASLSLVACRQTSTEVVTEPPAAPQPGALTIPDIGPDPTVTLPPVQTFELSNGIPVWTVDYGASPIVNVWLVYDQGASTEPEGSEGLSALTAEMINEGTAAHSALELSEAFELLATDFGSGASLDYSYISINALNSKLPASLDLLMEILTSATFPEEELARQRDAYQSRFVQSQASPQSVAGTALRRVMYKGIYGGRRTGGNAESLATITREQVVARAAELFHPGRMTVMVSGALDGALQSQLEATLGTLDTSQAMDETPVPMALHRPQGREIYFVDFPGASQSVVIAARPGTGYETEGYFSRELANKVFGGMFVSRLNLNLREDKGYTYGAGGGFRRSALGGYWSAGARVQSEVTVPTMQEMDREMRELVGERQISQEEFELARSNTLRGMPSQLQSASAVAGRLLDQVLYDLPEDWVSGYAGRFADVSYEAVRDAPSGWVDADNTVWMIVGDAESQLEAVRGLGWGEPTLLDLEGMPLP